VIRLISSELFKLRQRTMTWVLLYIFAGIVVILYMLLYAISRLALPTPDQGGVGDIENLLGLPVAVPFALTLLTSFGTVLAVIVIASAVGNEYGWHTIRIALISSESRLKFLGAKLISVTIIIIIGMIAGVIIGFAMSLITTAIGGYAFKFDFATGAYIWDQFLQFWRTFYVLMLYVMLGFLCAVLGRSALAGIAVGIGVLFLEPIITGLMRLAGGVVAKIPDYLLAANVNAIQALNQLPGGLGQGLGGASVQTPPVTQAYVMIAAYIVLFGVIAFTVFQRRDVTG
jgi:ABC-2 type transport system permease protein